MKKLLILVAILALSSPTLSGATPSFVYDGGMGTGTWKDVNKQNVYGDPDALLCWAAAASDVLAWTGWRGWDSKTSSYISGASDIYTRFVAAWPNAIGAAVYAYEWWMTDRSESVTGGHREFPTPGLNFYPGVDPLKSWSGGVSSSVYYWLGNYIQNHRGIVSNISVPSSSVGAYVHLLAVWGWDPDMGKIYLTDSDDGMTSLRVYSFYQYGSNVYIDDYSNLYTDPVDVQITFLTRLNLNPGIEPNKVVPEMSTLLFLSFGLLGLAAYGREFLML